MFTLVEMVCEPLSVPLNGVLLSNDISHGSIVSVSCLPGFMFPDRNLTQQLECISVGLTLPDTAWTAPIRDCQRTPAYY